MNSTVIGGAGLLTAVGTLFSILRSVSTKGPAATSHRETAWTSEVLPHAGGVRADEWSGLFPAHWKDQRYYRTLEETFAGEFVQRYLLLRDPGGDLRAVQPFFFVEQDLTVSLPAWLRRGLRPWRRWLRTRLLMVGCIVGEAQTGLSGDALTGPVASALADALERCAAAEGVSIVLFKDFPAAARAGMRSLTAHGRYTRLPSLPGVRMALDFASFDEYVQTRLGKATRKSLRRKFRETDALADPITLEVKTSVTGAEAAVLHALYERVALRGDVRFEVFDQGYFLRLGQRMPDQARYFIWRHAGRVVAFSFCTVHGDAIHDNDIGIDDGAPASLHLYHHTFRDLVRWALAQGLKWYHSAPFNYDPKRHLRMELVPLDLYAHHRSPLANFLLRRFAPLAAPTRQEPLLRFFPNAHQL